MYMLPQILNISTENLIINQIIWILHVNARLSIGRVFSCLIKRAVSCLITYRSNNRIYYAYNGYLVV